MLIKRIFISVAIFLISNSVLANECKQYEPSAESLSGIIKKHTSIQPADVNDRLGSRSKQVYWVLHLQNSGCMVSKHAGRNRPYGDVKQVQLHLNLTQFEKVKQLAGQKVKVTGVMWQAHSRYHKTAIVISVQYLEPIIIENFALN